METPLRNSALAGEFGEFQITQTYERNKKTHMGLGVEITPQTPITPRLTIGGC